MSENINETNEIRPWCNPKNFEGSRWYWPEIWYVPVQMVYGTMQSKHFGRSVKRAWESFERGTGLSRHELKSQGYRVKRVTIKPDWNEKPKTPETYFPN